MNPALPKNIRVNNVLKGWVIDKEGRRGGVKTILIVSDHAGFALKEKLKPLSIMSLRFLIPSTVSAFWRSLFNVDYE